MPGFSDASPIVREVSALHEALRVVSEGDRIDVARRAAREALAFRTPSPHLNPRLDEVIQAALRMIAEEGTPKHPFGTPTRRSSEEHLIETASLAWLSWAAGQKNGRAAQETQRVLRVPSTPNEPGALHRSTLLLWLSAIERLEAEDHLEARRLWRRAIEISSNLGTESHPAILWSYAASFFPR